MSLTCSDISDVTSLLRHIRCHSPVQIYQMSLTCLDISDVTSLFRYIRCHSPVQIYQMSLTCSDISDVTHLFRYISISDVTHLFRHIIHLVRYTHQLPISIALTFFKYDRCCSPGQISPTCDQI